MVTEKINPEQKAFNEENYKGKKNTEAGNLVIEIKGKPMFFWGFIYHSDLI